MQAKQTRLFVLGYRLAISGALLWACWASLSTRAWMFVALPLLHYSLAVAAAAVCTFANLHGLTFKDPTTGDIPLWSLVIWGPWLATQYCLLVLRRLTTYRGVPVVTELIPGRLWLGGYPAMLWTTQEDADALKKVTAVLDVTCELPSSRGLVLRADQEEGKHYRCLPMWDGAAPDASEIRDGVRWARGEMQQGRAVLVHCANGVGRSAAMAAALLLSLGVCADIQEVKKLLQSKRPISRLRDDHILQVSLAQDSDHLALV